MTWEDFLAKAIPLTLVGLGVVILKLWRSQAVTDLVIGQLKDYPKRMAGVEAGMKVVTERTGEIKVDIEKLTDAFTDFVRSNGK